VAPRITLLKSRAARLHIKAAALPLFRLPAESKNRRGLFFIAPQ